MSRTRKARPRRARCYDCSPTHTCDWCRSSQTAAVRRATVETPEQLADESQVQSYQGEHVCPTCGLDCACDDPPECECYDDGDGGYTCAACAARGDGRPLKAWLVEML